MVYYADGFMTDLQDQLPISSMTLHCGWWLMQTEVPFWYKTLLTEAGEKLQPTQKKIKYSEITAKSNKSYWSFKKELKNINWEY